MTPTLNGQPLTRNIGTNGELPPIDSPLWCEWCPNFDDLLRDASRHFVSDSLPVLPGNITDVMLRAIEQDDRNALAGYEVRLSNSSEPITK